MIESFSVSCENIYVTTVKMNKWKGKLKSTFLFKNENQYLILVYI